jgi:hypothetical protein
LSVWRITGTVYCEAHQIPWQESVPGTHLSDSSFDANESLQASDSRSDELCILALTAEQDRREDDRGRAIDCERVLGAELRRTARRLTSLQVSQCIVRILDEGLRSLCSLSDVCELASSFSSESAEFAACEVVISARPA